MFKFFLNIIFITIFAANSFSQDTIYSFEVESSTQYYLGFRILPTGTGVVRYVVVYAPGNKIKSMVGISKMDFLNYAYGRIKSKTNPTKINFFTKYGIRDARTTNDLWRLRYRSYPYFKETADTLGWSANLTSQFIPSKKQMDFLKRYGVETINDVFWGENCFRLIKDMENPTWRQNYINENF